MRDAKHLKEFQFKPKLASEEVKRINTMVWGWKEDGLTENQMIGLVMYDTKMSPNTCKALVRSALLQKAN